MAESPSLSLGVLSRNPRAKLLILLVRPIRGFLKLVTARRGSPPLKTATEPRL